MSMIRILGISTIITGCSTGAADGPPKTDLVSAVQTPIAVADAIEMVRVEDRYGSNDRFVAISPDGGMLATVIWRGDLERDVNLFSLLVIRITAAEGTLSAAEDAVLSVAFEGDTTDQAATPIDQLAFLPDNRTVAFLGTLDGGPRQVYTVDARNGAVTALTQHPTDVAAYAVSGDGALRSYAAVRADRGKAQAEMLRSDGVFPYDAEQLAGAYPFAAYGSVYGGLARSAREGQSLQYFRPAVRTGDEPTLVHEGDRPPSLRELGLDGSDPEGLHGTMAPRMTGRPPVVPEAFSRHRPVVGDERIAVGVVESLTEPPELAVHVFATGETTVITDLNPRLRNRQYGQVEQIHFRTPYDSVSTGWLVKPVRYQPDRRYPLVVLHSNDTERATDRTYLIDGRHNLSGHAAQPLAGLGFMVLFIGTPPGRAGTALETDAMREHTEQAIRTLAERGYVDTLRVGVSGWSRSAYYTDHLLIHSSFPYAAATQIDGGAAEYGEGFRPYKDAELARISAPLLAQPHGRVALAHQGAMVDRLRSSGKPADLLYFETAPHSTKRPQHRYRSLSTHIDWWRFWLQDHEDPDLRKASQYRRWRELRGMVDGRSTAR